MFSPVFCIFSLFSHLFNHQINCDSLHCQKDKKKCLSCFMYVFRHKSITKNHIYVLQHITCQGNSIYKGKNSWTGKKWNSKFSKWKMSFSRSGKSLSLYEVREIILINIHQLISLYPLNEFSWGTNSTVEEDLFALR